MHSQIRIATRAGKILAISIGTGKIITINAIQNPLDTVTCLYTAPLGADDVEITFATRLGTIGWTSLKQSGKVENVRSPLLGSTETKEVENAVRKLWTLREPNVVIYVQRNTICLCEKDQHNCLCLFKSRTEKKGLVAVDLINHNQQLAYTTLDSSLITIVSTANLEIAATVETSMPRLAYIA